MTQIKVDGILVDVPDHYTLMQAAEAAGAEIPRFCYHERLSVAGNCRMCLVEVKGGPPKPQASCAMAVRDVRGGPNGEPAEMFTNTPMVKKAREGVMEFLLINHPLDCPICDQAGECDLQDQAMAYGGDRARYKENKRAVEDKYIGPLVKTTMTRCIHCTRCVRFTTEVAGVSELGLIGRGEDAEITTYLEHALTSELQGNVIDLCPVGALTSRPYAFQARPWELTKTDSIDVMDAVGSNIRIDSRGREVLRILPRLHENVNEEWISDKARFSVDGLKAQRLDRPYIRKAGKFTQASWADALDAVAQGIRRTNKAKVAAIAGNLASVEDMFALKRLMQAIGVNNIDARPIGSALSHKNGRRSYLFNATIAGIEKADAILLIGSNPRHEAAVLNARIRKQWRNGAAQIAVIGEAADLTYSYDYLGSGAESLRALAAGKVAFSQVLKDAKFPLVIVGENVLSGENSEVNSSLINGLIGDLERADWLGYCVLHNAASRVGALDIAFEPLKGGKAMGEIIAGLANGDTEVLINMGNDEVQFERKSGSLVVYIGSHGDAGAHSADIILPAAAFSEKSGTYVNTEGRAQIANRAVFPPGHAKEDWAILRALAPLLNVELGFDTLNQLRVVLYQDYPHLARIDHIAVDGELKISRTKPSSESVAGFYNIYSDFYLTNPIARASEVMAECSRGLSHNKQAAE